MREEGRIEGVSCAGAAMGKRELLDAVGKALACILQEENPLSPHEQQAREAQLSRKLHVGTSSSSAHSLEPRDLSIISRLLNQVHLLMEEEENKAEVLFRSGNTQNPGLKVATENNMVETVVEIASAAAEAAKVAAAVSGKNLELMKTLLSKSEKNEQVKSPNWESDEEQCNHGALEGESPPTDKDLVKKLERQNRITHWILGFMVVATAIWRFKMLSMIMGVRRTFTNPFQVVGDMLSEGLKGVHKEDSNGVQGFQKARTVLPLLLGGEEKEVTKKMERSSEDLKIGEALTLSLDNMLSSGKSSGASNSGTEDGSTRE